MTMTVTPEPSWTERRAGAVRRALPAQPVQAPAVAFTLPGGMRLSVHEVATLSAGVGMFASFAAANVVFPLPIFNLLVIIATGTLALLHWASLGVILKRLWPLFLFPAVLYASAVWSQLPSRTLYFASLYTVSFTFAVMAASALNFRNLSLAVFYPGLLIMVLCLPDVLGALSGGYAAKGIYGSKNMMAAVAAMPTVFGFALMLSNQLSKLHRIGIAAGTLLCFASMVAGNSAGALVSTMLGMIAIVGVSLIQESKPKTRAFLFILMCIPAVALIVVWPMVMDFVDWVRADVLGKDEDLTGRKEIWDVADSIIAARPWLGVGFATFWHEGNPDALLIYRMAGVTGGFNFHHEMRDLLVAVGWLGGGVFLFILATGVLGLAGHIVTGQLMGGAAFVGIIVFQLSRLTIESGLASASFYGILFIMALTKGYLGPRALQPPAPPVVSRRYRSG
jgi:exopolysaccharide production protein ExoQ